MKYAWTLVITMFLATQIVGCASNSKNIDANSVSPLVYQNFSCDQLHIEIARIESDLAKISKKQDNSATLDAVTMTVGLVLFWPSLFLLAATSDEEEEIADLKGELEALERTRTMMQCGAPVMHVSN